jgi:mannose-6-phosphate isomerase-like protein (cupin superfamily)
MAGAARAGSLDRDQNEKERSMAYAGQTIENPISGERITFRRTAADTNGELLAFDLELSPNGHVPGMHVHPGQEERFEVVSGRMRFRKGLKTVIAEPGDVVVVPAGTAHKFANAGDEAARVRVEVRPALRMEELLETAVELAVEGRTTRKGLPKPLDLALFVRTFEREVRGAFPPAWVQRATLAPLAWLARKRGHGARYAPRPAIA